MSDYCPKILIHCIVNRDCGGCGSAASSGETRLPHIVGQERNLEPTMVNISFEPPLRVETRVKPAIQGDATINVTFYASLDHSEWQRLVKNGASVELWSDIPAEGKLSGSWGATTFVKRQSEGNQVHLEASLITLSSRGSNIRYSYTYRVRQARGEVQWLGNTSSNGSIIIESEAFWSPSDDSASGVIGTIQWASKWRGWLLSPEQAPSMLTLVSLDARDISPSAQTVLLVPGSSRKEVSNPPSLIIHSDSGLINVSHGKVHCETPKDVTVEPITEGSSVAEVLKAHGFTPISTSASDTFFVLSGSRAPNQSSISFHPIWLSPRIPSAVEVLSSDIKSAVGESSSVVIHTPGRDYSQPLLISEEQHEIPLRNGSEPLRIVPLQTIPNWSGQLVGISTPATTYQAAASPAPPSPTLTAVDPAALSEYHDVGKNVATVTVSKSSNVLFARTVIVPNVVTSQMERLFRFKLLYTFYRLALSIVSLLIPFLGIKLSLKISPAESSSPRENEKAGLVAELEKEEEKPSAPAPPGTQEDGLVENTLYYNVQPVGGEVNVTFLGSAADEVLFTVNGKEIDPWSVIQTWHGDDLHQFLLRMDAPTRLGVTIRSEQSSSFVI